MELHLPIIINEMARQRANVLFTNAMYLTGGVLNRMDRYRKLHCLPAFSALVNAMKDDSVQRFIFDGGDERSKEEYDAFQSTAEEMIAADQFHLPYPEIWIEDYQTSDPSGKRSCYFCTEQDGKIYAWMVGYNPDGITLDYRDAENSPRSDIKVSVFGLLQWDSNYNAFSAVMPKCAEGKLSETTSTSLYAASYHSTFMLQKFIASLAATNTVREPGETKRRVVRQGRDPMSRREKDFKTVAYPYTLVRPPDDDSVPMEGDYRPRKRHFVRGYTWGCNTRPVDQRRWIAPFWRGRGEAIAVRDHYEIKARKETV
jgi:hypothetical protein